MNKIAKRLVAGVSAAALLVSAVGVDQLADLFTKTSYAVYSSKTAKSTGFGNLEQDTDGENYNTGYGLHTNKTATALDDGRTFDVDLESWYVGENPVDVATILDASGSMAWTVDTLEPLTFDDKSTGLNVDALKTEYGIEEADLTKYSEYKDDLTRVLAAIQDKEENGGYLPQEIVDKILKNDEDHTDNSKLSYAGYKYYVYEDRSSVSEFVPLGYWDGGEPVEKFEPIGYYPFEDTLDNAIDSLTDTKATLIAHPGSSSSFDETEITSVPASPTYSNGFVNLNTTAKNGAIALDVPLDKITTNQFSITFDVTSTSIEKEDKTYDETPILYIGDGIAGNSYFRIVKGNQRQTTSGGACNKIRCYDSSSKQPAASDSGDTTPMLDFKTLKLGKDQTFTVTYTFDFTTNESALYYTDNSVNSEKHTANITGNFDLSKLKILVGGNNCTDKTDYRDTFIKNVRIYNTLLTSAETNDTTNLIASYALDGSANSLVDSVDNSRTAKFVEQVNSDGSFDVGETLADVPANVTYTSTKYKGDKALNLSETSKLGGILLDAKLTNDSSFTLSFAVRKDGKDTKPNAENILYIGGMKDTNKYYQVYRASDESANRLKMLKKEDDNYVNINTIFSDDAGYKFITIVVNGKNVVQYVDGKEESGSRELKEAINEYITGEKDLSLILGELWDGSYNGSDILIDDLYVFDEALDEDQVKLVAENAGKTEFAILPSALTTGCKGYHAKTSDGTKDIAQISERLAQNPNDEERRGWYYVNSASNWDDISGCLESGKQYVGIVKEEEDGEDYYDHFDVATTPNSDYDFTGGDNKGDEKYVAPTTERSIRFYVDSQNHLRCFAHAGGTSEKDDPRTFCSVVYEKEEKQQTKYEALNDALNGFYLQLATESDLSNSAIVRFSTHNLLKNTTTEEAAKKVLKELIIKDWTNWSDYYQKLPASEKTGKTKEQLEKLKEGYMNDLLIPADGETSLGVGGSAKTTGEYPYVMTGGTYTWTGLKAFYDNMVECEGKTTGYKPYDIANDARDKYLIIFTDGRDNNVGTDDNKHVHVKSDERVEIDGEEQQPYKNCIGNFAPSYDGEQQKLSNDSELAKAWADKLKSEGYTIFCVMMAAGSISPTAQPGEYNKAYEFVKTLAGEKADDENAAKYVSVIGSGAGEGAVDNVSQAFNNILKQIQQPRNDYTVQDYIDPRFDLVDKDGNLYKLGAGGNITVTGVTSLTTFNGKTTNNVEGNTVTVGNIIDSIDKDGTAIGLAYTPQESHMVNRTSSTDMNGDGVGTGYLYYDDVKDMYYLRWTDQIIPMENEAFDTVGTDGKTLDVWSATIRLKAKDDFIGGNNILTNGNEAGENLVYSDATIENIGKGENWKLYGLTSKDATYRQKLAVLSGTDRKINAVDAGGVSQAVYGNGIDIPSSGFPRTTVNVRLLPLNANNLNDVIYMGEVVSPTMMLADLENGYMTGSYYLQYLERYAYRVYGEDAGDMPLIELLNKWLKIKDETVSDKTFTIPYIYLPDPEYGKDNNLVKDSEGKVVIENSTGWDSEDRETLEFADLNLRDVTGFITYTWKRSDGRNEPQQEMSGTVPTQYDITKDYVVKNTNQIKYNLQLTFTPLKENAADLTGFTLDNHFIKADLTGKGADNFFKIDDTTKEFVGATATEGWSTKFGRKDYLQAMVKEERTYTPHINYNYTTQKWELSSVESTVTDSGVYDWDSTYKEASGNAQLESGKLVDGSNSIKGFYTDTPNNVNLLDVDGEKITNDEGAIKAGSTAPVSLAANTTYTKDVVNAALALELFVDGKYLNKSASKIKVDNTFTFLAIRNYKDPYNKPSYATDEIGADASDLEYQLTFKIEDMPDATDVKDNEIYKVWAYLDEVKVENSDGTYVSIQGETTDNFYTGYTDKNALPIGTYVIKTESDATKLNSLKNEQFKIGTKDGTDVNFKYLKIENDKQSYAYDKFPSSVYTESDTAADITKDGEYLIWNSSTDNSKKNIADNKRVKDSTTDTQTVTFYFGTVAEKKVGSETLINTKGVSVKEYLKEHPDDPTLAKFKNDYAKDRLGIIMLSADNNSLAITKKVDNTDRSDDKNRSWEFTVTVKPDEGDEVFNGAPEKELDLKWYKLQTDGNWVLDETTPSGYKDKIKFTSNGGGTYTGTVSLKHGEKVVITGLPEGTWQVSENVAGFSGTPHNDQFTYGEDEWQYNRTDSTRADIDLTPASQVNYINEFPYELPSAGGSGTLRFVLIGTALISVGAMLFVVLCFDRRKKARK